MKKILLSVCSLVLFAGITQKVKAQEDKLKENKNEEIIIRKHGDKNAKITVEINGDEILINGKPMSDFKDDDITVMKRKSFDGKDFKFFNSPGRPGGSLQFWNDDDNENESRTFLGVTTKEEENGVEVTDVVKGSASEKAGLQEGDIITKVGTQKISDPEDLVDAVTSYKPKEEVKVYYERKGKSNEVKVILGERKESRMRSFSMNTPPVPPVNPDMLNNFNFNMDSDNDHALMKYWGHGRKKLGIRIEDTENEEGVKITKIEEGSAAEKAGLKKGDIITSVDGNKVQNVKEVTSKVMETDKSVYAVKAKRNGTEMNFEIKIPKKLNNSDL